MKLDEYILKRNEIISNFSKKSRLWQEDVMVAKYNIVSACLSNYLPDININDHKQIFKNIFLHQQLSMFEQSFYELPDYVVYENLNREIWDILRKKISIICTFHTGSYRLINLFLARNKIPFSLIISSDVLQKQGHSFEKMFNEINQGYTTHEGLRLIDAESPNSALQMIKELKKGRNLVIYIDGNSGAGSETISNNNKCEINFLNQKIFARQGVGFLAQTMQVPVLTVASYRKSLTDIRLKFFTPLFSNPFQDRALFAKKITQDIYDLVSPIIKQYPEQWEAWLYLHKVADSSGNNTIREEMAILPAANDKLRFNSSCFGIFKIVKETFLFQKNNYKSYRISDTVYNLLIACVAGPVRRSEIIIDEFPELYKNKVLVHA
jgi:lauroyl/myristoyl acyltransferase